MDHRQHSTPKTAVFLILLLSVLLLLLHPTHLGNAPALLILATCFSCSVSFMLRLVACIGRKPNFFPDSRFGLHYLIVLHRSSPCSSSPMFFA